MKRLASGTARRRVDPQGCCDDAARALAGGKVAGVRAPGFPLRLTRFLDAREPGFGLGAGMRMFSWLPLLLLPLGLAAAPVELVEERPVKVEGSGPALVRIDFGRVSFGNLAVTLPEGTSARLKVHFGEAAENGRINRKPPGTVRYAVAESEVKGGGAVVIAPPADARNTKQPAAVLTPAEWGVVLPFRWVEIEGWPDGVPVDGIVRRSGYLKGWDDSAASFRSSDPVLDRIWELCRYSIKATTFAGVYVDGDRERIPYEADAYLNQLSHYAVEPDLQIARDTFDWLMEQPTWPTEWAPHMVFMAHADWMHSGETEWLKPRFDALRAKMLLERVGDDGLVRSNEKQRTRDDIVDWPMGERDGYVRTEVNTVVNAFHLAALERMAKMAAALGRDGEAREYRERFRKTLAVFHERLYMADKGMFRDGVGTDHAAQHASLFPLAFGLVPIGEERRVARWVASRGMRCSVYAAQYLMEGLFLHGEDEAAMKLILADGDRSWRHMVESGTTITWEAWDQKYKPNQDWNHAWGAAPANLLPRFVLGAEPIEPGWKRVLIRPCLSGLDEAAGRIPTPAGPLVIEWVMRGSFGLKLELPDGVEARVELPAANRGAKAFVDERQVPAEWVDGRLVLTQPVSGKRKIVVR